MSQLDIPFSDFAGSTIVHATGGTVVMTKKFDAETALRIIEEHRITHAQFVPTMFVRMLKLPDEVRGAPLGKMLTEGLRFAGLHKDIVERFGRFPHRNELLARESTMTTYLGFGVALPHVRIKMSRRYILAIGRSRIGIRHDGALADERVQPHVEQLDLGIERRAPSCAAAMLPALTVVQRA
mgnify:CR=1 FL=1